MIEALKGFPDNVVAVACHGQVTKHDYETMLVPAVQEALGRHDKVRVYYRIGPDFAGIDPGAIWEDLKVGIGHLPQWERIAVVTDVDWIGHAIRAFSFLVHGEVRVFPVAEASTARDWILAG